jgi:hypothetical protein
MRKHLFIACFGYMAFGISIATQQLGVKAGLGFWPTASILVFGMAFFIFSIFTSLEKIKDFIKKHESTTT